MTVSQRIVICKMIEQIEKRPDIAKRLGLENRSGFKNKGKKR